MKTAHKPLIIPPMTDLLACFSSHYSMSDGGTLTLEAKGKTKAGAPGSIIDLCIANNIKDCIVIESTLGGAYEASRNLAAAGVNLFLGYKVIVCEDHLDKSDKSIASESKVIIFPRNEVGWSTLIKIANRAATEGFYYKPRTSWKQLGELWTDDLKLALPFFSSFIATNTLTLNHVIPSLPATPTLLYEMDSGLPFAPLISAALDQFNAKGEYPVQRIKSIYYPDRTSFAPYLVYRAKAKRSTFIKPNLDHMASDRFCLSEFIRLRDVK